MTAEIAIINRSAIALAADSAVTVGREKVWKNTNKLFHLTPDSDVAVMFFGNADFGIIPWDVIIKQFRRDHSAEDFGTVQDAADAFRRFSDRFASDTSAEGQIPGYALLIDLIEEITDRVDGNNAKERKDSFSLSLAQYAASLDGDLEHIEKVTLKDFRMEFGELIEGLLTTEIEKQFRQRDRFSPRQSLRSELIRVCHRAWVTGRESSLSSGVVFAGYGSAQLLPQIIELRFDGRFRGKARCWQIKDNDLNRDGASRALVIPFAQSDIAYLFVEGMLPNYLEVIEKSMEGFLNRATLDILSSYVTPPRLDALELVQKQMNKAATKKFLELFEELRQASFIQPMVKAIASLPKEEMASMAEALVDITALRRKVDDGLETVGGPIDVAVISKADGFVWIKRKHYFDTSINLDYLNRRARRYGAKS